MKEGIFQPPGFGGGTPAHLYGCPGVAHKAERSGLINGSTHLLNGGQGAGQGQASRPCIHSNESLLYIWRLGVSLAPMMPPANSRITPKRTAPAQAPGAAQRCQVVRHS